ncbi:exportin-T isoform X4 [Phyllopteryx taeniolatus]|uniref:exportin-T isoform X4 n=1 Tax=Phyllopteryx taeniolatus TaxID=161469 RepID=UPI002AD5A92F|nr:exportin-T isoform X4 [Phyllopteryx taeniolatus]
MDEEALLGLDPNADAPYRQRAMAYFEQLKESQDAWEVCAQALAKGLYSDDHVKFFCFQVLEHQIKFRHAALSGGQRQLIRETLMKWLQNQLARTHPEKIFVRNKAAQVLALTFVTEYPALWPEFFFDVLALIGLNPHGVDIYLRTLMAVDGEVVDRDVLHAPEETRRNTLIKDAMREQCIPSLVESWFQILHTYQLSHPELTCQCLEVVGAYVSWIDLGLIANERFVELLLGHMSVEELREEACDCLLEIVNKGMDPVDKTRLVESLCRLLRTAGFFYVEQEDVDFLAKLSRLVNGMGQSLVLSWTKLAKAGSAEDAGAALDALEAKVAPALRLLAHPDDDISANVVAFCYEYLHVLKQVARRHRRQRARAPPPLLHLLSFPPQLPELSDGQKSNVEAIMRAVIKKLAYDDEYNFDNEGEDEAMFVEYRKQLKMLLDRLAQVAPELVLEAVIGVFGDAMRKWRSAPFAEVEVAVRLLYMLGEALPASHGAHFSGDAVKTGALRDMMRTLVTCGVSGYRHTSVTLDFFETVVRYDKFFIVEPQHIPDVLMAFLDQRGLRHDSPKVRSRAAYLFSRFIKTLHKHVTPFTEDILTRIQDLVEPAPPGKASSAPLTADDQLFVFEAAGVLIVSGESAPERKEALMRGLLAPPVAAFRPLLDELAAETDEEAQAAVADRLSHAVGFVSRTSKAFSNKQTVKQCGCIEVYRDCLRAFLPALGCPVQRGALRGCVRSFLHRMIICMEEEVLPFVPAASEHMLKDCEAKDLQEFIPLISQIAAKFKRQVSPFLRQIFMPLVLSVFEALARPADADDQAAALEKQMLRRSYFSFVQTVAGSGADEVLADQGAENVERVVFTVIQGAVEVPDPVAQKTCFAVLARLVELWGGEGGMSGFGDFTYKHIVPACFLAPLKPTFDLSDAQTTLTLSEVALTLKSIYDKQGPELLEFLRRDYLPSLRVCPDVAQELCLVLQQPDAKVLKTYLKVFFQRARL